MAKPVPIPAVVPVAPALAPVSAMRTDVPGEPLPPMDPVHYPTDSTPLPPPDEPPPQPPLVPVNRMLTRSRVWVRNVSAQPLRHALGTAVPGGRFQLDEDEVAAYGAHVTRE